VSRYDYVAVGHVTRDLIEDEDAPGGARSQPGGTAFYSALQAARLGLRASIVTQGVPSQIEHLLAPYRGELDLHVIRAPQTTTLATRGEGAERVQSVLAWAGPIVEAPSVQTEILHLAPVARETRARWRGRARFVGVTPQGLVRAWSEHEQTAAFDTDSAPGDIPLAGAARRAAGEVGTIPLEATLLPSSFDAAVISEHERACCPSLFTTAEACGACVAVTAGARPASLYVYARGGEPALRDAMPHPVAVRDDLGAGDVFAAAFFVALSEGREPLAAAAFAHTAAGVRIAAVGADAIGTRAQIAARLA
jgi:hypothetical protein